MFKMFALLRFRLLPFCCCRANVNVNGLRTACHAVCWNKYFDSFFDVWFSFWNHANNNIATNKLSSHDQASAWMLWNSSHSSIECLEWVRTVKSYIFTFVLSFCLSLIINWLLMQLLCYTSKTSVLEFWDVRQAITWISARRYLMWTANLHAHDATRL